jgi:predicted amidohydrolase
MKTTGILILERKEIASLLSLKRCMEVVETAFRLHAEGKTLASGLLHVDADGGEFHIKAGGLKLDRTSIGRRLSDLAAAHRLTILAGFFEREDSRVYNSQLVAWPDGRRACQRKHNLTEWERAAGLAEGPRERTLFDFGGVRCAILVCADVGIPGLGPALAQQGVEFLFIPTGGGGKKEEMLHESDLDTPAGRAAYARDRTAVFKPEAFVEPKEAVMTAFASANALGYDGRATYHRGHCMIVDRHGVLRAQLAGTNVLEHQQDQMVHAVLSFP